MKAIEVKLLAFLQKSPQFLIPIYQRTYSWTGSFTGHCYQPQPLHSMEEISADIVAIKIGYEVSFTRHFYKPQPLRTLEEISADIVAIEREAEGLLDGLLKAGAKA